MDEEQVRKATDTFAPYDLAQSIHIVEQAALALGRCEGWEPIESVPYLPAFQHAFRSVLAAAEENATLKARVREYEAVGDAMNDHLFNVPFTTVSVQMRALELRTAWTKARTPTPGEEGSPATTNREG